MMGILGGIFDGCGDGVGDARAMTADEIRDWQISNLDRMRPSVYSDSYIRGLANYRPNPERPLDERFAEFKGRLAAAMRRREVLA